MNIAVIDDIRADGEYIKELICKYSEENGVSPDVFVFSSADEFFKSSYRGFSAVFTDIVMPGVSGMDLARKIRESDGEIPLIFISAEREYALEGYEVQAFDYILKPVDPERVKKITVRLLRLKSADEKFITIKQNRRDLNIPVNKILYAEARNHNVEIYTTEGNYSVYMTFGSMMDLFSPYPQFISCRRGVIVNMEMVKKPDGSYFLMKDNFKVFISRSKVTEVNKQYADYIFSKTRGDADV